MSEVICKDHGWYGGRHSCPICDLYDRDKMDFHGCTTGDCPHEKQGDCDDTLSGFKNEKALSKDALFQDMLNELIEIHADMIPEGPDEIAHDRIGILIKMAKAAT